MDKKYHSYIEQTESTLSDYAKSSFDTAGRITTLDDAGNRTEFERDVQRVLHSQPFRRLMHKTQVFFSPINDHICTRMEHSLHVASISVTICKQLNLNTTLAEAISVAHDLGHPPFGHLGEKVLNKIHQRRKMPEFTHEAQSLRVIDYYKDRQHLAPLNLTYEVRDGVVFHYGEGDEQIIMPEEKDIKSVKPEDARKHSPSTLEGCVVRMADKIAYLGRDLEDAQMAGFIKPELITFYAEIGLGTNNSQIIGNLIDDIVKNSENKNSICFSDEVAKMVKKLKDYNYKNIYYNSKLQDQERRIELIYSELFRFFLNVSNQKQARQRQGYYYDVFRDFMSDMQYPNTVDKKQIVNDFIAGMTDRFALSCFEDLFQVKPVV